MPTPVNKLTLKLYARKNLSYRVVVYRAPRGRAYSEQDIARRLVSIVLKLEETYVGARYGVVKMFGRGKYSIVYRGEVAEIEERAGVQNREPSSGGSETTGSTDY